MALLGTITKQPDEKLPYDVDYAEVIGERVATIGTPAIVATGLTISNQAVSGTVLQFYVAGGTDATSYLIEITTDITVGGKIETIQDEIQVVIEEIG